MKIQLALTPKNIFAFILFGILMGEAHEISHFITGKIACGCWPTYRDFNSWRMCECDLGFLATATGPVFSMALAWLGMFLLRHGDYQKQSLGFMLIWANVPQARIATVLGGGGDETVVMRILTEGTSFAGSYRWITVLIVFIMALPPIVSSFIAVKNKFGWLINIGFMVGSLMVWGLYLFGLMNKILWMGVLNEVWIMGTPLLITLHTLLVIVVLIAFFRKEIFTMVRKETIQLAN